MLPVDEDAKIPLGSTLILTSVSVGSVGQFAVDLIVSTLKLPYVCASAATDCFIPVIGRDPFYKNDSNARQMSTAFEVFGTEDRDLIVLQQRSGFAKHKQVEYLNCLVDWIKKKKFKRVILLSSCFAAAQINPEMQTSKSVRYLSTSTVNTSFGDILKMEFPDSQIEQQPDQMTGEMCYPLMGGGIAKHLYKRCEEMDLPFIALVMFCNEGYNNVQDAFCLADNCNKLLNLKSPVSSWKPPHSWNQLLEGVKQT